MALDLALVNGCLWKGKEMFELILRSAGILSSYCCAFGLVLCGLVRSGLKNPFKFLFLNRIQFLNICMKVDKIANKNIVKKGKGGCVLSEIMDIIQLFREI